MLNLSSILILNLFLYFFNEKLAQTLNLYDNPDKIRKFHKTRVPLTGGIIILFNFIFVIFNIVVDQFLHEKFSIFVTNLDIIIFLVAVLTFFLIGFIDDKYKISPNKRFIFIAITLLPIIIYSEDLIINQIKFSFSEYSFYLPYLISIFWTILCFLLFINAINMFDGINYQVGIYFIYLSLFFLLNNYFVLFFSLFLFGMINFLILNHKYKSFLGDSGTYFLAFIFGYFFIKMYNQTENIKVDHIFLFMIIPGIDLIRLFITRILKNKNPFMPDRNHFHHIISKRFNLVVTNFLIQSAIIIPSALGYYFGYTYIFLLMQMLIYFYFVLSTR